MVLANVFLKLLTVKNFVTPLCKKHCFGTRLDSRNVKVPRILAKSRWDCFYHVFLWIWRKLIRKRSPLELPEIWGVFVNTLTADGKYPIQYWGNLELPIQMQLSEKWETFSQFSFHFWNLHQISTILKKKMMVLANVFLKLRTLKTFVTPLCKKRCFGTCFDSLFVFFICI